MEKLENVKTTLLHVGEKLGLPHMEHNLGKVFVTGGTGVVGYRTTKKLLQAGHDKVREAFRKARASLGEDVWDWKASQVGPPLSEEVLEQKKAKEAEKRRRKKQKAKEKKAKERQAQEEAAVKQAQQEKEAEQAKAEGRTCDCCKKPIRGRKNVFKRLEYQYCSTKCVNDHKRELMASAALARFGG